jgi:hypothetical protein
VVEHGGNQWRDYLRFRDLLRHQPAIRRRYAELKRGLVSTCGNDRGLYTASKADFIRQVLDRDLISAGQTAALLRKATFRSPDYWRASLRRESFDGSD